MSKYTKLHCNGISQYSSSYISLSRVRLKKKCCNLILLGNNVKNPVCNKKKFTALCLDWGAIILVNFGENP